MSSQFEFIVTTPLTPSAALRALADVRAHGEIVPLTSGRGPHPSALTVGDRLIARTAIGPFGFDDVMEVREFVEGELLILDKVGALLGGRVRITVRPTESRSKSAISADGSLVTWQQSVRFGWLEWLPSWFNRALKSAMVVVLARGYRHFVPRVLAAAAGEQ